MRIKLLLVLNLTLIGVPQIWAHGPGHVHRSNERESERAAVNEVVSLQETAIPVEGADAAARWWGANFTTGWESRHVHYGVDETGPTGAYVNELGVQLGNLSISAWNGIGTGNTYSEWDFTVAYNIEVGSVFIIPGYNLRYTPSYAVNADAHGSEEHATEDSHEEEGHEEDEHGDEHSEDSHASHTHNTIGNELFIVLGTTAIPYVTPSANFIWDLNSNPGGFMELRLDGDVPLYKDLVSLQPYSLLGLNFGYNTTDYYGWNNFQFGVQATVALHEYVSVFAGVNYSVALKAVQQIDQDNVVWANVGVSFAY